MRVLVSVQSPELVASAGTFPDLCPFASSQDPHLPHSLSRSLVSSASSWSLRCSTSSVNQQISSELRMPHLSFFLPPSSVSRFSLLASSYPRLPFLFLPPSLPLLGSVCRQEVLVRVYILQGHVHARQPTCTRAKRYSRLDSYIKADI